ncbi:MAG: YdcH family protein [Phenylobacterium sp.]|uniref:YdcH family protein n=1 Tax=Phenylobacterium sp. TaxID=1871053 RepID=UPI001A5F595B|nr:YdcH family protein [Phenylobacterium sp.]MBL8770464.1 YdcH family protein [Phenylobacterium sp.]
MNHYRIWRLRSLHRELEQRIRDERRRLHPDELVIQDLKRRKLQVKDELFMAEAGLVPVTARMGRA